MNIPPKNHESRKHALITPEQEILLRLFESVKKMSYGQIIIYLQAGNIVRSEVTESKSFYAQNPKKLNAEILKEISDDIDDSDDVIAI